MFPVTDNPAERLLAILTEAKKIEIHHVNEVLAKQFGYNPNDKVSFYRTLGYLNELLDQVELRIRQIPGIKHELFLRDIPAIRSVITPGALQESWPQISQPLKQGALTCLDFCADALSQNHQEAKIENADIVKIKARISSLYKSISESDLDPDLKSVVFDLLTTIQTSIDNYKIKGADGLKRSLVYASGLIKLHQDRLRADKDKPVLVEVSEFVNNVAIIVTAAYNMKELAVGVGGLLGFSPDPTPNK